MAETGDTQIIAVGHSAGTAILKNYLNDSPERSARIAKFIALDSASGGMNPECPGNPAPVDCIGIYRDDNPAYMGPNTYKLPLHGHTQCVTSVESFALQYEYVTGDEPETTLVLPEPPGQVEISGRLVYFPANIGLGDATIELWEVNPRTGARNYAEPDAVFTTDASGDFGPVQVNGQKSYEFVAFRPDIEIITHYYFQRFLRDDHLIRLLASPADSSTWQYTAMGPDHVALVILRYFEWWNDQENGNDTLWVTSTSAAWDDDPINPTPGPLNLLSDPLVAPRSGNKLGIHTHDKGADKVSTLTRIFPFYLAPFQTSADIWMPATEPPDGTITFTSAPRGDTSLPQTIAIQNWASEDHRVLVQFNTYFQDINSWGECRRAKPSPCK